VRRPLSFFSFAVSRLIWARALIRCMVSGSAIPAASIPIIPPSSRPPNISRTWARMPLACTKTGMRFLGQESMIPWSQPCTCGSDRIPSMLGTRDHWSAPEDPLSGIATSGGTKPTGNSSITPTASRIKSRTNARSELSLEGSAIGSSVVVRPLRLGVAAELVLRARPGAGVRARQRALIRGVGNAPDSATSHPLKGAAAGPATTPGVRACASTPTDRGAPPPRLDLCAQSYTCQLQPHTPCPSRKNRENRDASYFFLAPAPHFGGTERPPVDLGTPHVGAFLTQQIVTVAVRHDAQNASD
jgi:hypothetical protein